MCNPAALMAAGTAVSAYGSAREGRAAKKAAEAGARLDEIEAADALSRGSWEEQRYRRDVAQLAGTQRATIGARNATASGSALDLIGDTARIGEEDALMIRENARREALGLTSQAAERRRQGKLAQKAGYTRAGATLLTGGAQSYGMSKRGG